MVVSEGKYVSDINTPEPGLTVVDFAGDDTTRYSTYIPDMDSNGSIKFKAYLDKDSGLTEGKFYNLKKNSAQSFRALIVDSSLYLQGYSFATSNKTRAIDITGRDLEILEIEVIYTSDDPTAVNINEVSQTVYAATYSSTSGGVSSIGSNAYDQYLTDATIWDVRTYTSGAALTHQWLGTGVNANLDSAWTDQVGVLDMTVIGSPATRSIP